MTMKKIVAAILCSLLCFQICCFGQASAAEVRAAVQYTELSVALQLLESSALQRKEEKITRGELTAAVVRLSGVNGEGKTYFTDVEPKHIYYREISLAREMGLVNGFGDDTFRPDENATYAQALKMLVYLAGYGTMVDSGMSIERAAVDAKISRPVQLSDHPTITVSEAAELLVRTGDVKMLQWSGISADEAKFSKRGDTVFNICRDIYKAEGLVTANAQTYLNEEGKLGKGFVMLDSLEMEDKDQTLSALLGCRAVAYYYQPNGEKAQLLFGYADNNDILSVKAEDVVGFANDTFYYKKENEQTETEHVRLSDMDVIYNGKLCLAPAADDFKIGSGSIELIDNNHDGTWDVVKIWKYETCLVDAVNYAKNIIYCKYDQSELRFDDLDDVNFFSRDKQPMSIRELAEWDVLAVARSKNNDFVTVIYIPDVIEGTVTALSDQTNALIEIDDSEYKLSKTFTKYQFQEAVIGQRAMFYFDLEGRIACVNMATKEEMYGYLIGVDFPKGLKSNGKIKLMDTAGKQQIYPLAEKLTLDGDKLTLTNDSDKNRLATLGSQVILYRLDEKNEAVYIDTAYYLDDSGAMTGIGANEDPNNTLVCIHDGYDRNNAAIASKRLHYRQEAKIFTNVSGSGEQVALKPNTLRFDVPKESARGDEVDFWVYDIGSLDNDGEENIRAYKRRLSNIAIDVIVTYRDTTQAYKIATDYTVSVVDKVTKAINSNGDVCYKLTGYTDGRAVSYMTQNDAVLDNLTLNGKKFFSQTGDVVRLAANQFGELHAVDPIYSLKNDSLKGNANPNPVNIFAGFRVQIAYAYYKNNDFVQTTTSKPDKSHLNSTNGLANVEIKNLGNYAIYLYDSERDEVSIGTTDSLIGFKNTNGVDASKLFIYERYGDGRTLIIYQ